MIIDFLSRQNEEIVQVELIKNYLREIESNNPIILSKFESEIFRDRHIDIKVDHKIIRIRLREIIQGKPTIFIRVFNEQDLLLEEVDAFISDYLIKKSRSVLINHAQFDSNGNIIERQYVYQKDNLKRNKERVIETSEDEIEEITHSFFSNHSIDEQKELLKEHNGSIEEVIKYLQTKINFNYIIKKIEEERDIKIAYQSAKEQPSILFKKFDGQSN